MKFSAYSVFQGCACSLKYREKRNIEVFVIFGYVIFGYTLFRPRKRSIQLTVFLKKKKKKKEFEFNLIVYCVNLLTCFIRATVEGVLPQHYWPWAGVLLCDISSLSARLNQYHEQRSFRPSAPPDPDYDKYAQTHSIHTHILMVTYWSVSDRVLGLRCWMCDTLAGNSLLYNGEWGRKTQIALL